MRTTLEDEEAEIREKPKQDDSNKVQEVLNAYENSTEQIELKKEIELAKALPSSERTTTWKPLNIFSQVKRKP